MPAIRLKRLSDIRRPPGDLGRYLEGIEARLAALEAAAKAPKHSANPTGKAKPRPAV